MLLRQLSNLRPVLVLSGVFFFLFIWPFILIERRRHYQPLVIEPISIDGKSAWHMKPPTLQENRLDVPPLLSGELEHLHLLVAPSSSPIHRCKTLLTAAVLGYPTPTLIGWKKSFDRSKFVGGGRYLDKISGIYEWLASQPKRSDSDLVLVVDTYGSFNYQNDSDAIDAELNGDLWFQLPPETLIRRYHAINAQAKKDMVEVLGDAVEQEGLKQTIVFGAGKRCSPFADGSLACWPIPESPLPSDVYGLETDQTTDDEHDDYSNYRARYLNPSFIMGPLGDMRAMFRRASSRADEVERGVSDTLPAGSPLLGSDMAIFQHMWGQQEFQRDAMRRRHQGDLSEVPASSDREMAEVQPGKPHEFGIGVDYWSDLGHQTFDAVTDGQFITYWHSANETGKRPHKCKPNVSGWLPFDIINTTISPYVVSDSAPFSPNRGWDEVALYTDVCHETVPVMVQYNSAHGNGTETDETVLREGYPDPWSRMWMQPHARMLIDILINEGGEKGRGRTKGAFLVGWNEMCPKELDEELFREYTDWM